MCGIAGVVGTSDRTSSEDAVMRMIESLARRGPDGHGLERWSEAVLGHRRLAIFDLSEAGRQPMMSPDRSIGVVFNGSIYNHRALKEELASTGYLFKSQTDTEVLVHGYHEWGLDKLVAKLRGMFAFGLWDDTRRTLYLVRDRLGVKPLVWARRDRAIAFASTVRSLKRAGWAGDLDERAVAEYLSCGFVPDHCSIYQGTFKLPAASILEWNDGRVTTRTYWTSPTPGTSVASFGAAVERAEDLLLQAVERRLHADVPIGILLSGGIDSALVCWAASRLGRDITAYTVGTPGDPWDESAAASQTARTLGLNHCILDMRSGGQDDLQDLIRAYAEPFACASALGMLKVSNAVSSSAKVLLTGDGGDDVFLGYPRHRHVWIAEKLSRVTSHATKQWWRANGSRWPRIGPLRRLATLFDYMSGSARIFGGPVEGLTAIRSGLAGDRLRNQVGTGGAGMSDGGDSLMSRFVSHEYRTRFVGEYMTKVDGATMHYGVEARSPFLDQLLWEFAASLPFNLRLHHGHPKAVLREVARRRVSIEVATRTKHGFGIPVQRWMVGPWRPLAEVCLRDSVLEKEGWIQSRSVSEMLEAGLAQGTASLQLWYVMVLELWMRYEREQTRSCAWALR